MDSFRESVDYGKNDCVTLEGGRPVTMSRPVWDNGQLGTGRGCGNPRDGR